MKEQEYVDRLTAISNITIKRLLQPINPYKFNIKKLAYGRTLEVGCGIGRNLGYLGKPFNVGIDVNESAINYVSALGHTAFLVKDFDLLTNYDSSFDHLLFSHVLEHMTVDEASTLVKKYLKYVKPGGTVIVICPQMRGYLSDPTHVEFMNPIKLRKLLEACQLKILSTKSFPLPKWFGRLFIYNEYIVVAEK